MHVKIIPCIKVAYFYECTKFLAKLDRGMLLQLALIRSPILYTFVSKILQVLNREHVSRRSVASIHSHNFRDELIIFKKMRNSLVCAADKL